MKVARKSLSVLLSVLMFVTSISVAFTGLNFTAFAEDADYSALTGNEITLDGGAAMSQIKALIGALSGRTYDETSKTPAELAEEYGVPASVLSGQGMSEYPYSAKDTEAQTRNDKFGPDNSQTPGRGAVVTDDERVYYTPAFTDETPVRGVYTGSVSVDLKTYLLSHRLEDVEDTIDLEYEYSVETDIGRYAEVTEIEWYTNSDYADHPYYHVYESHIWQYTKAVSGQVTDQNTTARAELDAIDEFVNRDYYKNPELLAGKTADQLTAIKDEARALREYAYDSDVWDHFWGAGAMDAFDDFIATLYLAEDAGPIIVAYRQLNQAKADYDSFMRGKSYNTLSDSQGATLGGYAATIRSAYDALAALGFDEDVYNWIKAHAAGLADASQEDAMAKRDAVVSTNFSYLIFNARKTLMDYIAAKAESIRSVADVVQANQDEYEAALTDEPGAEDPTPVITFETGVPTEIGSYINQITSYKNALEAYRAQAADEYAAIVSDEDAAYISDTLTRLNTARSQASTLATIAGVENQYKDYFEDVGVDLWTDMAAYSNAQAIDRYDYIVGTAAYTNYAGDDVDAVTGQVSVITTAYNNFKNAVGQQTADAVFSVTYKGSHMLLQTALTQHANNVLKPELVARENAQISRVVGYSVPTITFDNFSTVDAFVASFDYDLYNYTETTVWNEDATTSRSGVHTWANNGNNSKAAIQRLISARNAVDSWKESGNGFRQWHGHNSSNVYWTRYAGSYGKNSTTTIVEDSGRSSRNRTSTHGDYSADIARRHDDANNDYTVKTDQMNATIVKLDTFLTSRDFTDTLGLQYYSEEYTDEDAEAGKIPAGKQVGDIKYQKEINNISEYIHTLLNRKLFTNDMITTIFAAIYPMVADMLDELIHDLPNKFSGGLIVPSNIATFAIDVGALGLSHVYLTHIWPSDVYLEELTGTVHVYMDTAGGTVSLAELASRIGVNIYPQYLAASLQGVNNNLFDNSDTPANQSFISKLRSMGNSWNALKDSTTGKVTKENVEKYLTSSKWGVTETSINEADYFNTFLSGIGYIFTPIQGLLKAVMGTNELSGSVLNAAAVETDNLYVKVKHITNLSTHLGVDRTLGNVIAKASKAVYSGDSLVAASGGVEGYSKLWIPLMEALGVRDSGYDVTTSKAIIGSSQFSSNIYNFRSYTNGDMATLARAMFEPLLVLIDQLADKPIYKVTSLLPNLLYHLSLNSLQSLLKQVLLLNVHLEVSVDSIDVKNKGSGIGESIVGAVVSMLDGTIKNAINDNAKFDLQFNLGEKIILKDLLEGTVGDYTNINAIVRAVLDMTGVGLVLPDIDASKVIQAGELTTFTSANGTGGHKKVVADNGDVFWRILQYIAKVARNKSTVNSIISLVGGSSDNSTTRVLRMVLDAVVTNINKHPDDAAAALVELFNPNVTNTSNVNSASVYQMFNLDWINTAPATDYNSDINKESMVYVTNEHYGHRWTRTTAEEMAEDITPLINQILRDLGGEDATQITTFNERIQTAIMGMFTNEGLAGVLEGLVSLGKGMITTRDRLAANGTTYTEETENMIAALLKRELNVDMTLWYKEFPDISGSSVLDDLGLGAGGSSGAAQEEHNWSKTYNGVTVSYSTEERADGDGHYTFTYGGTEMTKGDYTTFMNVFVHLCSEFAPALGFILSGQDLSMFANALTIKGFEGYTYGLFPIFEVLGIKTIKPATYMSRANAHDVGSDAYKNDNAQIFAEIVSDVFGFIDSLLYTDEVDPETGKRKEANTLKILLELMPKLTYLIESNALSASLKNILMPVLVLIDNLRPIVGIDIDALLSVLLTELLPPDGYYDEEEDKYTPWDPTVFSKDYSMKVNGSVTKVNFPIMLIYYALGAWETGEGWTPVSGRYSFTVDDLSLHGNGNGKVPADKQGILGFLDQFLGTNLLNSALTYAMKGLTRGISYTPGTGNNYWDVPRNSEGWIDGTRSPDAADVLTILLNSLLETIISSGKTVNGQTKTNGVIITEWLDKYFEILLDQDKPESKLDLSAIFETLQTILTTGEITDYATPDWLYMGMTQAGNLASVHEKATNSAVYLDYKTNWSKATAETVDGALESILGMVFNNLDEEGDGTNYLRNLIKGILNDNVYSPDVFHSIIGAIYNAISSLGASIFELAGIVLDIDAQQFLADYGVQDPATGAWEFSEEKVDETFAAQGFDVTTQDGFIAAAKYVLSTLDTILDWLLFGEPAAFFTKSDKEGGQFTYEPLISIAGGKGYEQAIVYLLEMLGMKMNVEGVDSALYSADTKIKKADAYKDAVTGKYKTSEAVGDILEAVVTKLDDLAGDPINGAVGLVLNLIYFINAKGLSTLIANLLAPVDKLLVAVVPLQESIDNMTSGSLAGMNLTNILGIVKSLIPDETKAQLSEYLGTDIDTITLHNESVTAIRDDWDALLNWNLVFGIVEGVLGFTVKDAIRDLLKNFYMGSLESYVSSNGKTCYRMVFNGTNEDSDRADFITILLSMVLETIVAQDPTTHEYLNRDPIVDLIAGGRPKAPAVPGPDATAEELAAYADANRAYLAALDRFENETRPQAEGIFDLILALYTGVNLAPSDYARPDWDYLAEDDDATLAENEYLKSALDAWVAAFTEEFKSGRDAVDNEDQKYSNVYLNYVNWDKATADGIVANASVMIDSVLALLGQDPMSQMIKKLLSGIVYTQYDEETGDVAVDEDGNAQYGIINNIVEMTAIGIAKLALQLEASTGLESDTIFLALEETLGVDVAAWYNKLDIVTKLDEEGNTVIDEDLTKLKADAVITTEEGNFGEALADALEPLGGLISWLFFGGSYTFFNDTDRVPIIKLKGGFGYDYSILYILEALGVEELQPGSTYYDVVTDPDTGIRTVTLKPNGVHKFLVMLGNAIEARVNDITDDAINTVIQLLPAFVYFIGSDGLTCAVTNLVKPITALLAKAESATGETFIDIGEILASTGLPLSYEGDTLYLGWDEIFDLLENLINIHAADEVKNAIKGIYVGTLHSKDHVSENAGEGYVTMTADTVQAKADILTILIGALGDIIKDPENEDAIAGLLQDDEAHSKYNALMNLLAGVEVDESNYKLPDWGYAENGGYNFIANAEAPTLPDPTNSAVYIKYTNNWSQEAATLLDQRLEELINVLLAEQGGLAGVLTNLLNDNLYSKDMLVSLIESIYGLIGGLDVHLVELVGALLAGNIGEWLQRFGNYHAADPEVEGDKDAWVFDKDKAEAVFGDVTAANFGDKLYEVISPLNDLLAFLLQSGEYTFFDSYKIDEETGLNEALLTIKGGDGYTHGLAYLLEALGCKNLPRTIDAPETEDFVKAILNSLVARLNDLATDDENGTSLDKILELLPEIIYFINSKALGTMVDNIIFPLETLIGAVSPIVGSDLSIIALLGDTLKKVLGDDFDPAEETDGFRGLLTFDNILKILENTLGLYFKPACAELLGQFYIGKLTRIDGTVATERSYRMGYSDEGVTHGNRVDMITIVLSLLLDTVEDQRNKPFIMGLLTKVEEPEVPVAPEEPGDDATEEEIAAYEQALAAYNTAVEEYPAKKEEYDKAYAKAEKNYEAILSLFNSTQSAEYILPDWDYLAGEQDYMTRLQDYVNQYNTVIAANRASCVFLTYGNDWGDRDNIENLAASLDGLVQFLMTAVVKQGSIWDLVQGLLEDNVYTTDTKRCVINELVEVIALNLKKFEAYLGIVDVVLGTEVESYLALCDYYDADGNLITEFTEDTEIAEAKIKTEIVATDEVEFADALAQKLEPIAPLLDWFLFNGDMKFFYDAADGQDQIYLRGGAGWDQALVYLVEALGIEITDEEITDPETGKRTSPLAIRQLIIKLVDKVRGVTEQPITGLGQLIPNLLYFLGANGLGTILKNILAPVNGILGVVNSFMDEDKQISIEGLAEQYLGTTLDVSFINLDTLFEIIHNSLGITVPEASQTAIKEVLIGTLATAPSANGTTTVTLKAETSGDLADFVTLLLSIAGDIVKYDGNKPAFVKLLGGKEDDAQSIEDATAKYNAIRNILDGNTQAAYKAPNWGYWEGSNYTFTIDDLDNPVVPRYPDDEILYNWYNKYWNTEQNVWSQETAEYITDNLSDIVAQVMNIAGVEGTLSDMLRNIIDGNIYSSENFNTVLKMLYDLLAGLDENILAPVGVLLKTDFNVWLDTYGDKIDGEWIYVAQDFSVADAAEFTDTLVTVLAPVNRIVEWFFLSKDLEFLYDSDASAMLTVKGGEGYANSLVYLLEALGVTGLKNRFEIANGSELLRNVVERLLVRIDEIETKPINELVALLPNLIYFINAGGLGAVVSNLVAPIDALLAQAAVFSEDLEGGVLGLLKGTLEEKIPGLVITDDDTIYSLLSMDSILGIVTDMVGITIPKADLYVLRNFYIGRLDVLSSANNHSGFRMVYAQTPLDSAVMLTYLIGLLTDIVEEPLNKDFIIGLLAGEEPGEDATAEELAAYEAKLEKAGKTYAGLIALFNKAAAYVYTAPDWDYLAGEEDYSDRLGEYVTTYNPIIADNRDSCVFLQYGNDWGDKDNIENLAASLDGLVQFIMETVVNQGSIWDLLQGILRANVYGDGDKSCVLNDLVELIAVNVKKFESIIKLADMLLGTEVESYLALCDYYDDHGDLITEFTEETVIASAKIKEEITIASNDEFTAKVAELLAPVEPLLNWFFFEGDLNLFYGVEGDDQLYLRGGAGYDTALIYLIEALGIRIDNAEITVNGKRSATKAVEVILDKLFDKVETICDQPIRGLAELVPNLIYFLGANGVGTILNNLLTPVNGVLGIVNSFLDEDKQISIEALMEQYLNTSLEDVQTIDLDALFEIVQNAAGITIPEASQTAIKEVLIGSLDTERSANGSTYVTLTAVSDADVADFITLLLSVAGDIVKCDDNEAAFVKLLGGKEDDPQSMEDATAKYNAVRAILDGEVQASYEAPDWGYMDEGYAYTISDLDNPATPAYPADQLLYNYYNKYWTDRQNNWNQETAEYVTDNLARIIDTALSKFVEEGSSVAVIVQNLLNDKFYSSETFSAVLKKVYDLVAGLDSRILAPAGVLLKADLVAWLEDYGTYDDAEGKYVYNDDQVFAVDNAAEFKSTLLDVLAPLERLVEWLFLSKDLEFLYNSNGSAMLTVRGGDGYNNALVYLLEALGVDGLKKRAEFDNAQDMLDNVIGRLLARIDGIAADPVNEVIALLPNILYFINANGLGAVVDNLVAPVDALITEAAPFAQDTLEGGVFGLVKDLLTENVNGLELGEDDDTFIEILTMDNILKIVKAYTGIKVPADTAYVLKNFYIGKLEAIADSGNNHTGFRMVYAETPLDSAVMLTVLIGIIADIAHVEENQAALKEMLGENGKYIDAVANILDLANAQIDYTRFNWLYIYDENHNLITGEDAYHDGDIVSAAGNSTKYSDPYANQDYWTPQMAQDVAEHLERFIGNIICLLGLELNGQVVESLDEVIKEALNEKVFTQANMDSITAVIKDKVIGSLKAALGDELYEDVVIILKDSINVDLKAWEDLEVILDTEDAEGFEKGLDQILAPVLPLLNVVLCGESLTFFYYSDGADVITIPGAEGYKFSVIPLLEALTCEAGDIATVEEFKVAMAAACAKDASDDAKYAAINMVLDPVFNKIESISTSDEPINDIFNMLPAVIYFINSEGLNTVFQNIVASLDAVLAAVEPITGEKLTVQKLAFKEDEALKDYDFAYLMDLLLAKIGNNSAVGTLAPVISDFVTELTTGVIRKYDSKNGDTRFQDYYTMDYATAGSGIYGIDGTSADMITVILRILIDFITDDENIEKIKELLKDYITDEKTYAYVCAFLDSLKKVSVEDPSFGQALYLLYKAFIGVEEAVNAIDNARHDANNTWAFLFYMMKNSSDPELNYEYDILTEFFNKYFKDIISSDVSPDAENPAGVVAPNGLIKFFKAISDWIQKIMDFFKQLFGG